MAPSWPKCLSLGHRGRATVGADFGGLVLGSPAFHNTCFRYRSTVDLGQLAAAAENQARERVLSKAGLDSHTARRFGGLAALHKAERSGGVRSG